MDNGKLKVVIVGAGYMGETHAGVYKKIEDVEVYGVVDKNHTKASDFAGKYCCLPFSDLKEALACKADFVDICLPTPFHKESVIESLRSSMDVICEKPISLSVEDAKQMVEASEQYGKKLMIAHVVRFWAEYAKLYEMVKNGEIAGIKCLTLSRYGTLPAWSEGNWLLSDKKSGSIIFDLVIHDIDFAISLFGMPHWVFACKSMMNEDYTLYVNSILGYKDVNVLIETGFAMSGSYPFTAGFRLSTGSISYEYVNKDGRGLVRYSDKIAGEKLEYADCNPYEEELRYFIECLKNNRKPVAGDGYDAIKAVKVAKCLEISANTNERVNVI